MHRFRILWFVRLPRPTGDIIVSLPPGYTLDGRCPTLAFTSDTYLNALQNNEWGTWWDCKAKEPPANRWSDPPLFEDAACATRYAWGLDLMNELLVLQENSTNPDEPGACQNQSDPSNTIELPRDQNIFEYKAVNMTFWMGSILISPLYPVVDQWPLHFVAAPASTMWPYPVPSSMLVGDARDAIPTKLTSMTSLTNLQPTRTSAGPTTKPQPQSTSGSAAVPGNPFKSITSVATVEVPVAASSVLPGSLTTASRTTTAVGGMVTTIVETTRAPDQVSFYSATSTILITNHANWKGAAVMTITDALGNSVKTSTSLPVGAVWTQTTVVPPSGTPFVMTVPITTVRTIFDNAGAPKTTATAYLAFPHTGYDPDSFRRITISDYLLGTFIPVLLATFLSIATETVDRHIKALLPFHALTRPSGSTAADSLCLEAGGFAARLRSLRLLLVFGEPLSLLSDIVVLLSAVLVAVSSEAVGMKLHGSCSDADFRGCYMTLGVFLGPARVIEGFLVATALLLGIMMFFVTRFRCGVASPSIASIASLLGDGEVRLRIRSMPFGMEKGQIHKRKFLEHLAGYRFALRAPDGIVVVRRPPLELKDLDAMANEEALPDARKEKKHVMARLRRVPMVKSQILFVVLLCGLLALILYYKNTRLDTPFERFMDSQHFGVKTLFTVLGVATTLFWDGLFSRKYTLTSPTPADALLD